MKKETCMKAANKGWVLPDSADVRHPRGRVHGDRK